MLFFFTIPSHQSCHHRTTFPSIPPGSHRVLTLNTYLQSSVSSVTPSDGQINPHEALRLSSDCSKLRECQKQCHLVAGKKKIKHQKACERSPLGQSTHMNCIWQIFYFPKIICILHITCVTEHLKI